MLIAGCSVAVGLLILVLSGLTYVRANQVAVVEQAGVFNRLLTSGFSYNFPLRYRIVGRYETQPQRACARFNSYALEITFCIADAKAYHYAGHCFLERLEEVLGGAADRPAEFEELILATAAEYAVEVETFDLVKTTEQ